MLRRTPVSSTHFSVSLAPSLGPRRLCLKVRSRALYLGTKSVCAASTTITCKWRNRYNELLGCTTLARAYLHFIQFAWPAILVTRGPKSRYATPHLAREFAITVPRVASLRDAMDEGVSREWYSGRDAPVSMFDSLGKLVAHRVGYSSAMVHRK